MHSILHPIFINLKKKIIAIEYRCFQLLLILIHLEIHPLTTNEYYYFSNIVHLQLSKPLYLANIRNILKIIIRAEKYTIFIHLKK